MSGSLARVVVGQLAPDFQVADMWGADFRLSSLRGVKNVVMALNRGFFCPFCVRHMSRLHAERDTIRRRNAEIVIVGPDNAAAFRRHWEANGYDFVGIPDPERRILRKYGQQVKLMRLGRLPATIIVDTAGIVRYVHYGGSMMDIPAVETLAQELDKLTETS